MTSVSEERENLSVRELSALSLQFSCKSKTIIKLKLYLKKKKRAREWIYPCPSTGESINKRWSVHTTEYCSSVKRNELLIHTTVLMNLQSIRSSARRQTKKGTHCAVPFLLNCGKCKLISSERKQICGCRDIRGKITKRTLLQLMGMFIILTAVIILIAGV